MIPKWVAKLMAEDRSRSCMDRDEHGSPLADECDRGVGNVSSGVALASPGYRDANYDADGEVDGAREEERRVATCRNFEEFSEEHVGENPNFVFGDGVCPGYSHVIDGDTKCDPNCGEYEVLE